MTSPRDLYRQECEALGIVANSGLLRMLPETTAQIQGVSVMHLGRNYLGDRGIIPLLHVVAQAKSLHTLNLRDNGIGNDGIRAICRVLRRHPSLCVLELSGNPFTYLAARQLVHLCEDSDKITFIGMENTLMTEQLRISITHRLQAALKRRENRRCASNAQNACGKNVAVTAFSTSAVAAAADSSFFSVNSGTATSVAATNPLPIIAEDTNVMRKLHGIVVVDPASLFPPRNSRNNGVISEVNGENSSKHSDKSGLNSIQSSQRPPIATPPSEDLKAVPEWFDMEENNDGTNYLEGDVEVEVDPLEEDEVIEDKEYQMQQETRSSPGTLSPTVKGETVHSSEDSVDVLSPSVKEEKCTDYVPDGDTLTPSVGKDSGGDWLNMEEEEQPQQKKQGEQQNKPKEMDFLDLLFGGE
ncbi:Leucine-rich repeat [Trypanosoma melophagium]|uniref:Leucine-rich repeat n=1 Tax=Trypanosoma melophagium TaxID=715481 RepID=UPI00351A3660|nr:Leucine-rich repeat [Trypanosoma melophagium]